MSNRFEFHRRFARVGHRQSKACMGLMWPIRGRHYWHLSTMAGLRSEAWWDILRWPILCISISHWMKLKSCKNPCKKEGGVSLWPVLQDPLPTLVKGVSQAAESDIFKEGELMTDPRSNLKFLIPKSKTTSNHVYIFAHFPHFIQCSRHPAQTQTWRNVKSQTISGLWIPILCM